MTPTWTSTCENICKRKPMLKQNLGKGRLNPTGRVVVGCKRTPPTMVKGPLIFWTVVLRTIRVDPGTRPTAMGEVLACSNCSASRKPKIVRR